MSNGVQSALWQLDQRRCTRIRLITISVGMQDATQLEDDKIAKLVNTATEVVTLISSDTETSSDRSLIEFIN